MTAPRDGIWLDGRAPDPTWWPPPSKATDQDSDPDTSPPDPGSGPPRRRPHPVLIGLLVLALVLALIWALGGFGARTDQRIPAEPGQLIVTGPYEFSFTRATAQRINRFGSEVVVEVRAIGTGRTTGDEAISPSTLNPMFIARDDVTRELQEADGQRFGPGGGFDSGDTFTPGLPPVEFTVTFEFSENYRPGSTIVFAVSELEYTDTSLLGTGEKVWNNADRTYVLQLPVTKLPDDD